MSSLTLLEPSASLVVNVGGYSCAGNKVQNEDAFAALTPDNSSRHYKGIVGCIADGVSCSDNAQLASQLAVTQFIEDYYCTPDSWSVKTAAVKVLSALNYWLYQHSQQQPIKDSFLTTFSAVIIKSTTAYLFHIGDSRLYLFRHKRVEQLTNDHRLSQGKQRYLNKALGAALHIEVDYQQIDVQQGDIFVLTTDGVHDVVSDQLLIQCLNKTEDNLEIQAKNIVQLALEQGSSDNISCLLLHVDQLPVADFNETQFRLQQQVIPPIMKSGMKIDGYEIQDVIHSSSRSHLYLVESITGKQKCILKAPSPHFSEDVHYLEHFACEQWVAQRINHPNLIKGLPCPENSCFQYVLYEYVEGQTLRQWMYDNPKPSLEQVRLLVNRLIKPLRALQRLCMVHRDLKPDNIMLEKNGEIKIIDLGAVGVQGLAEINNQTLLRTEQFPLGSTDYIAPEYLLECQCSHLTDLFSLATIIYEMLAGELPFNVVKSSYHIPKSYQSWHYHSIREKRPDIPLWFDLVLKKALSPYPNKRYQSFSAFYFDLCTPNQSLISQYQDQPLVERNPVLFWKALSTILFILLVLQVVN
ncbi:protein kinase domain-containing protein [Zooshikella sp. RANM57]|uniref:protein kinase domain-containing protein n=1 Tax=Zooshikella sp. RANM57 TaxID=3425863 RepID=UPI003D6FA461